MVQGCGGDPWFTTSFSSIIRRRRPHVERKDSMDTKSVEKFVMGDELGTTILRGKYALFSSVSSTLDGKRSGRRSTFFFLTWTTSCEEKKKKACHRHRRTHSWKLSGLPFEGRILTCCFNSAGCHQSSLFFSPSCGYFVGVG